MRRRRARRAFSLGSVSTKRRNSGLARNSPAAGVCAWHWPPCCSAEPELLLLDEPTNYLDLEGTVWLEEYLRDYPHTVLIVSHDRELLNRSVTSILHLQQGKLTLYTGGYDTFEQTRREQQRLDLKLKKKQDDERRHIEAFIIRFKAKASKATQAQSRVKALARMQPIAELIEERVIPFVFPNPAKGLGKSADQARRRRCGIRAGAPRAPGFAPAARCR